MKPDTPLGVFFYLPGSKKFRWERGLHRGFHGDYGDHCSKCLYGLGILATLLLIGLLVAKELSGAASYGSSREISFAASLDRVLNVAVIPLLFAFAAIVADKVMAILR